MGHYPFTLFNGLTLLILLLAAAVVWLRFRGPAASNWPLVCYGVMGAYTAGFSGGLNPYWVAAGAVCAVFLRFARGVGWLQFVELVPLGYVAGRAFGLLMMW